MKGFIIFFIVFSPWILHASSARLINNSPYDLRAVIRGADGTFLGEVVIKSQKETTWTDTYGQYGSMGGANARLNQNYRSQTPYTVLWYCMDGGTYAVCDTVSTGAVVTAQGCNGPRMCKPQKKEMYPYQPQDSYYPNEPQGNYLYVEPPSTQTSPAQP